MTHASTLAPAARRPRAGRGAPLEPLEPRVLLATYTVTNTNNDGAGSLRQAIVSANANAGADTIRFNIPTGGAVATIQPASPLPPITGGTDIDATSQPGYTPGRPVVQLRGPGVGSAMGLYLNNASHSRIRGLIINGWGGAGIYLAGGTGVVIESNWIGLNATGTAAAGNGTGVAAVTASAARIGGTTAAQRNVISGNNRSPASAGINLDGNDHVVTGNYIGTNADGTAAVANATGVRIRGDRNRVGGATAGERNVISGNVTGVHVGKEMPGSPPAYAYDNVVAGNYIGTNATGQAAVANTSSGVLVGGGAGRTVVGGTTPGSRNLISGNVEGVTVYSRISAAADPPPPAFTRIEGNTVGLSASGARLQNNTGVALRSGNTVVGGTTAAARNVISGNGIGIKVSNNDGRIEGNYIGLDPAGDAAAPNSVGVLIESGWGVTVGGTAAGAGNIIAGNFASGIHVFANGLGPPSTNPELGHRIQGNFIGVNANGDLAVSRRGTGIELASVRGVLVGGDTPAARNVVSGLTDGIWLNNARECMVQGNYVGTNASGADRGIGNTQFGVVVSGANVQRNVIHANVIAHSGSDGVRLTGGTANSVLNNSIHSNGGLGINLGTDGVTPNDSGDADTGPNELQNFPVLRSVLHDGANTLVRGTVEGVQGDGFYRVQFFSSPAADPSGYGEGARFLGETTVSAGSTGAATFHLPLPAVEPGHFVTATATASPSFGGWPVQTSEFSAAVAVPQPDTRPPRVVGVMINSAAWTDGFRHRLQAAGAGSRTHGYAIPAGPRQRHALPWTNLDEITIEFDEPVDVQQDDLIIRGRAGILPRADFTTSGTTATWRLASNLAANRVRLELRSGGTAGVTDALGRALDGEWVDNADSFPSGNGAPGGNFVFSFNVLPGNAHAAGAAVNRTTVNVFDLAAVRAAYGSAVTSGGQATPRFSVYADLNGDGRVNAIDLMVVRKNLRGTLPA